MEGNQMKMREALVWLSKTGHRTPEGGWMCINLKMIQKDGKPYPVEVPPYAEDVINAALSEPPRNCDVGTEDEQLDRYGVYCQNRCTSCDKRHSCRICGERYRMKCMMKWTQMPYEEKNTK